jgi:phage terminase large subunit-like protein
MALTARRKHVRKKPQKKRQTRARARSKPKVRAKKKPMGGRPRLSDREKARRGTLKPYRARTKKRRIRPPTVPPAAARDYVTIARQYAADVLSGRIVACTWVRLACERQDRDVMRSTTEAQWPFVWSDAHATEACAFIEQIPHVEGRWASPTIHLEPCQVFLVTCLFGWRQRAHVSRRRFTMVYFELGRKGAKSTLMAAIALFHVLREHEPGASVVCGATTGSQARIVFGIAQQMVRRSRWLRDQGAEALANAIITSDGSIRPVNAKASTQDGLNPSCIVLDESHAQKFALHDVLKSAQGARPNPLLLCPTTAGYDLLSVGYALRTTLTKLLQQVFEADHFLGIIYTLDEGDDWRDARVWVKANPMLGITPTLEWVRSYCADAQQTPGLEGEFRVKVCSQWLQSAKTWLSMGRWDACADPSMALEDFAGQRCWIGGDLAQLDDIAAVALVFERGQDICAFVKCYLPRDVVDERARAVPAYRAWVDAGILDLTDGNMIDYGRIEADIRAWCKTFNVVALRFDQYGSAQIVSSLAADGFAAAILDKNRKSITPPARDLEARVRHGRFRHDGNSCLKWMASNAVVTRGVDDSLLPKKDSADSPNKIDGIDAILQAMSAMLGPPPEKAPQFQMMVLGT